MERENRTKTKKALQGFDDSKERRTNMQIKDGYGKARAYRKISLPPPISRIHKHASRQKLYEHVHAFLAQREWAELSSEEMIGGATWIELFALFDTSGARTPMVRHISDEGAEQRAAARSRVEDARGKGRRKTAQGR